MKTVITNAGIKSIIDAEVDGPKIKVSSIKVGNSVINPTSSMTDVTNQVWSGDTSYLQYSIIDDNTFMYRLTLDEGIGDFDIGNIGLFLEDGTMLTITTLFAIEGKLANSVSQNGNRRVYDIIIQLSQISSKIDVSIMDDTSASLPFVQNESSLPSVNNADFNCYQILYHTVLKSACLALKNDGEWKFLKLVSNQELYNFELSRFDSNVEIGDFVYYNASSNIFEKATSTTGFYGIYNSSNNIITNGTCQNLNWSLSTGLIYYLDASGELSTSVSNVVAGIAVDTNVLYLYPKIESQLNRANSISSASSSTFKYASEKAIVDYIDSVVEDLHLENKADIDLINTNMVSDCCISANNGVASYSGLRISLPINYKVLFANGRQSNYTLNSTSFTTSSALNISLPASTNQYVVFLRDTGKLFYILKSLVTYSETPLTATGYRKSSNSNVWYYHNGANESITSIVKVWEGVVTSGAITTSSPVFPLNISNINANQSKKLYWSNASDFTLGQALPSDGQVVIHIGGTSYGHTVIYVNGSPVYSSNSAYADTSVFMVSAGDKVTASINNKPISSKYFIPYL